LRRETKLNGSVVRPEKSGEKWREVERSGEEWRGVERSGEEWVGIMKE